MRKHPLLPAVCAALSICASPINAQDLELLTIESIVAQASQTINPEEQNAKLADVLKRKVPNSLKDNIRFWQVRGAVAIQLNKETEGKEAGRRLLKLNTLSSDNEAAKSVLILLNERGWVEDDTVFQEREKAVTDLQKSLILLSQRYSTEDLTLEDLSPVAARLNELLSKEDDPRFAELAKSFADLVIKVARKKAEACLSLYVWMGRKEALEKVFDFLNAVEKWPGIQKVEFEDAFEQAKAGAGYYPSESELDALLKTLVPPWGKVPNTTHWTKKHPEESLPYVYNGVPISFRNIDEKTWDMPSNQIRMKFDYMFVEIECRFPAKNLHIVDQMFLLVRNAVAKFAKSWDSQGGKMSLTERSSSGEVFSTDTSEWKRMSITIQKQSGSVLMKISSRW